MSSTTLESLLYVALAAVIFWTAFCRLALIDGETRKVIRVSFWGLGAAGAGAVFSVLFWGHQPGWPDVAMLAAFAGMQLVTSSLWSAGVPTPFQKDRP